MFDIKRVLGFIWAAPASAVGLAFIAVFSAVGWLRHLGRRGDAVVWVVKDDGGDYLKKLLKYGGLTMGNIVALRYDPDTERGKTMLRHEQEHVRQHMALGPFMPLFYWTAWIGLMACRNAHPYYDNPFEIDARRASNQIVDVIGAVRRAYAQGKLKVPQRKR